MKLLTIAAAVMATVTLSGCVIHPLGYGHRGRHYQEAAPVYQQAPVYRGDRDRDGVPNRYDRRPGNPSRY